MSRSAACAFPAAWLLSAVFVAGPALAGDTAGRPASGAPPAAPAIEVVRDGGVAEAWREEGSAFATHGADGRTVVPTVEQQALQALANAYDVRFVRFDGDGGPPSTVAGDSIARYALAREVAAEAIGAAAPDGTDGEATYTHALAYTSDGHAWELQLCFDCGRYALRRDGVGVGTGSTGGTARRAAFDALFDTAAKAD